MARVQKEYLGTEKDEMYTQYTDIVNELDHYDKKRSASIIDIRAIENAYSLCSIMNIRNDNCAFLRITCFSLKILILGLNNTCMDKHMA